jgi:DNA-binding NarL/FixJ family response regulator
MLDVEIFELLIGDEALVVVSISTTANHRFEDVLSRAERQVALDAASGLSNRAIAARRGTSIRTIANQLASIYRKLGVSSRAELTALFAG